MRRILLLILALGLPPQAAAALAPQLADLDELPLHVAPAMAVAKAVTAAADVKGSGPWLFAVTVGLPVDLAGGRWDAPNPQTERWRTRIYSAGARSLLMEFARFQVPAGAALWIYDAEGRAVQGPYTAAQHSAEGTLWTATVPGEMAVIELRVPSAARDEVALELGRIGHGFRNTRDLGDSGRCHIDTICPLGNNWRDEIRATVKLQIPALGGFVGLCSGVLVNNLAQDDKPYVLTADHCGIGETGSPASGVVTYWNFANSVCSGTPDAVDTQNQTGAVLRADDVNTDMTLIELSAAPNPAFNVYYAGWDASGTGGSSGVGLHHPAGDAKKISEFTLPLTATMVQIQTGGAEIPAWRVNGWSQGVTEPGSSGSGLWNQNRHVVGTLSGGSAACDDPLTPDNEQTFPDYYARLDRQWTANAAAAGQLKAWLDPANTGIRTLTGKNPAGAPTVAADDYTVAEDSGATDFDVLANDESGLTLVSVSTPDAGGSASIVNNRIRYTPAADFNGSETFRYSARNAAGRTASAVVTVTVTAVNDPPRAVNDSFSVTVDTPTDLPVLANDSAAPDSGETLSLVSVVDFSAGGSGTIVGTVVRYTPAAGFTGTETFTYTIRDPGGLTGSATVTVSVVPPRSGGGGALNPSLLFSLGLLPGLLRRALTRQRPRST